MVSTRRGVARRKGMDASDVGTQSITKQRNLHCDTLLWPSSFPGSSSLTSQRHGYAIGWSDLERWDSGGISVSSRKDGSGEGKYARTTVCACVIPGYSLDEIKAALDMLSDKYECASNSPLLERSTCSCCTCACIRSLEVIAIWGGGNGNHPATLEKSIPTLLTIQQTPTGPRWKDNGEIGNDNDAEGESDPYRSLIWYNPTGDAKSLEHFKLEGCSQLDMENVIGFPRTLMRLSESTNISNEILSLLDEINDDTDTICPGPELESEEQSAPEDDERSNLGSLKRFLTKMQQCSLTAIHCKNISFYPTSWPPLLSQIPSIYCIQCLRKRWTTRKIALWASLTSTCKQRVFIPREIISTNQQKQASMLGQAFLDSLLGLTTGILLLNYSDNIRSAGKTLWNTINGSLLRDNIGWLETFPVGFKLNVPLTTNMGREILLVVSSYEEALSFFHTAMQIQTIQVLGIVSLVFGFGFLVGIVFDVLQLSTVHVRIISRIFGAMFRTICYTISSLWKLFRGKKRNPLRHRTDTLEYDSMQLLLGTILFTCCLFLFTTIFIYYSFFTVVSLSVTGCTTLLWLIYSIVQSFPFGGLFIRITDPDRFPKNVHFTSCVSGTEPGNYIHTSKLVPSGIPLGQVLTIAYEPLLSQLLSSIPTLIVEVITGKPFTIVSTLLNFLQKK